MENPVGEYVINRSPGGQYYVWSFTSGYASPYFDTIEKANAWAKAHGGTDRE